MRVRFPLPALISPILLDSYKYVWMSEWFKETVCKTVISWVRIPLHTLYIKFNSMNEKEIFEDQIADYWVDYYKSAE